MRAEIAFFEDMGSDAMRLGLRNDRGVDGSAVAEQNLVGDAVPFVSRSNKLTNLFGGSPKVHGRTKAPIGGIPGIEIDLGDTVTVLRKTVGQLAEEGRANALEKKKRTLQAPPNMACRAILI
jgi:hypothetical protein